MCVYTTDHLQPQNSRGDFFFGGDRIGAAGGSTVNRLPSRLAGDVCNPVLSQRIGHCCTSRAPDCVNGTEAVASAGSLTGAADGCQGMHNRATIGAAATASCGHHGSSDTTWTATGVFYRSCSDGCARYSC